jgi:hypothetical protein
MNVREYINILEQFPPDDDMMSLADEFVCYYPSNPPELKKLRLRHCKFRDKDRWEDAEFVEEGEALDEKWAVCI